MAQIVINEISQNYTYNIGNNTFATVALPITASWGPCISDPESIGSNWTDVKDNAYWGRFPATREGLESFVATYRGPATISKSIDDYSYQQAMTLLASGYDVLVCRVCPGVSAKSYYVAKQGTSEVDYLGIAAKYPGSFGNNIIMELNPVSYGDVVYYNAIISIVDENGNKTPSENLSFVFDDSIASDSLLFIGDIESRFITFDYEEFVSNVANYETDRENTVDKVLKSWNFGGTIRLGKELGATDKNYITLTESSPKVVEGSDTGSYYTNIWDYIQDYNTDTNEYPTGNIDENIRTRYGVTGTFEVGTYGSFVDTKLGNVWTNAPATEHICKGNIYSLPALQVLSIWSKTVVAESAPSDETEPPETPNITIPNKIYVNDGTIDPNKYAVNDVIVTTTSNRTNYLICRIVLNGQDKKAEYFYRYDPNASTNKYVQTTNLNSIMYGTIGGQAGYYYVGFNPDNFDSNNSVDASNVFTFITSEFSTEPENPAVYTDWIYIGSNNKVTKPADAWNIQAITNAIGEINPQFNINFFNKESYRQWVYTAAYEAYDILTDKLTYNPQRLISPGWDDQNIADYTDGDALRDYNWVISPLHKKILEISNLSRCATGLIDVPKALPIKKVDVKDTNDTLNYPGYAQLFTDDTSIPDAATNLLYLTHSALICPWGHYQYVGTNRQAIASPAFLFLLLQRAMLLNQAVQYEWALPVNRKTNLKIGKLDWNISKHYLDEWQSNSGINVNCITNVPDLGLTIWGNSTLFNIPSATYNALQNLSTRYLMNALKDLAYRCGIGITFQYNNDQAYDKFYAGMTPLLDTMKNVGAINDYYITMATDINGLDQVNANTVIGKVYFTVSGVINDMYVDLIALPPQTDLSQFGA